MARTKQTQFSDEPETYHTQKFKDHAGETATRVRHAYISEPIPEDFHANPTFMFQIYISQAIDVDQELPYDSTRGRMNHTQRTILTDVVEYFWLDPPGSERPPYMWEIYTGVDDVVDHQRREIAHRKGRREERDVPPIPKMLGGMDWSGQTGFLIVVDLDAGTLDVCAAQSRKPEVLRPLWVDFDRRFPNAISWDPRQRLDGSSDKERSVFSKGPLHVLPQVVDATYQRMLGVDDMARELGYMYSVSSASSMQAPMEIGWDEDEGTPEDNFDIDGATAALRSFEITVPRQDFIVEKLSQDHIRISDATADPDLRYIVYAPFLHRAGCADLLEVTAKAFTYAMAARLTEKDKTMHLDFYKPPSAGLASILSDHKSRPAEAIGALTTFPGKEDATRAYPLGYHEDAASNDLANATHYRTFLVVVERPDFIQVPGSILFVLANPDPWFSPEYQNVEISMRPQSYDEIQVWRYAGMDGVARRLQMIFGGVEWKGDGEKEGGAEAGE